MRFVVRRHGVLVFAVLGAAFYFFVSTIGIQFNNWMKEQAGLPSGLVLERAFAGDTCITRQEIENQFSYSQYFLPSSYPAKLVDQDVVVYRTVFTGGPLQGIPMYTTQMTVQEKERPENVNDTFGCFHTLTTAIEKQLWRDPP